MTNRLASRHRATLAVQTAQESDLNSVINGFISWSRFGQHSGKLLIQIVQSLFCGYFNFLININDIKLIIIIIIVPRDEKPLNQRWNLENNK